MKRTFTLLAAALATTAAAQKPYHRDLAVQEVNREAPRTEFVEFASRDEALTRSFERSDAYRSLDGVWKFRYADDVRALPADATAADADTSAWSDIRVPGNWELQGHGTPIYVNTRYEYATIDPAPPHLPEAIPAGVYRRTFTVPEAWAGRRIYLTIGGAKSGVYVYVNGREAGYNEDSKNPAQYRIDPLLRPGENTLALKMTRWSTGSYLEAQDFWRISGIERTVYLSAETPDALRDFEVVSTLDDSYRTGLFTLKMFLAGDREVEAGYELLDPEGRTVASGRQQATGEALFRAEIPDAAHWTAETPDRYRLVMHVRTPERTVYVPFSVGFRRFEFADAAERDAKGRPYRVLLVNGQPVKFKGVNLHEHDPRTGHYVDEELLLRDMRLMKAHNVNAIRTCHYPQQRRFYELCDSLGFYVYSEANVESHGMGYDLAAGRTLGNDRAWWPAHETRLRNMYMRCRNYPSVSIFSPANESGNGYNFYKAYEWLEAREKGEGRMNRPICYERAQWEWNTDMFVPMYPTAGMLEEWGREGTDRPVVPCEYSHAMGNSNGSLWLQWQSIYKYPNLQGGFIWDWVDQAFDRRDDAGRRIWAFGGDLGFVGVVNDSNFCVNGLVDADRIPHPHLAEVKKVLQYIDFRPVSFRPNEVEIENRHDFASLDRYRLTWELLRDGDVIRQGELPMPALKPGETARVAVPYGDTSDGAEYFLTLRALTRDDAPMIPAGHIAAYAQFPLQEGTKRLDSSPKRLDSSPKALTLDSSSNGALTLHSSLFTLGAPSASFWRPLTDNDIPNGHLDRCGVWKTAAQELETVSTEKTTLPDGREATTVTQRNPKLDLTLQTVYTPAADGSLHVEMRFIPGKVELPELPKLGMTLTLPGQYDNMEWYGRGPGESYPDRCESQLIGRWKSTVWDQYHPYVRAQETGNHCDVRWMAFRDKDGRGLLVVPDAPLNMGAWKFPASDIDYVPASIERRHGGSIVPRDMVTVNIDSRMMGVGGDNTWGAQVHPEFTVSPTPQSFSFTLIPLGKE